MIKYLKFINFNPIEKKSIIQLIKNNICETKFIGKDWIGAFLLAVTGRSRIPVSGFPQNKRLRIELNTITQSPYDIHTCFNQMILNRIAFAEYQTSQNKKQTKLYQYFKYETLINISELFNTV